MNIFNGSKSFKVSNIASLQMSMDLQYPLQCQQKKGGFLGPIISDVRDNYIDEFRFPTLGKGYFRFVYNFCVRIR